MITSSFSHYQISNLNIWLLYDEWYIQRCKKEFCLEAVVCLDLFGSLLDITIIFMIDLPLCYFSFEMNVVPFPNQPVNHLIQGEKRQTSFFYKMRQLLLLEKERTFITRCSSYFVTNCGRFYYYSNYYQINSKRGIYVKEKLFSGHIETFSFREISEEFQTNLEQKLIKFRENNDA